MGDYCKCRWGDGGPVAEQRRAEHRQWAGAAVIAGGEARGAYGACAQRKGREVMEVGPVQACRVAKAPRGVPNLRQSTVQGSPATAGSGRAPEGTHMRRLEKGRPQRRAAHDG